MPRAIAILAVCLSLATRSAEVAGREPSLQWKAVEETQAWRVLYQGRIVFDYVFTPGAFKPYVRQLCTPAGDNILRDSPADHRHHHGLMYGIKVNGLNFWEEVSGSGIEKVVETRVVDPGIGNSHGAPRAVLTQVLHWLAPEDAFLPETTALALLIERRTLILTLDEAQRQTVLEWKSEFEAGVRTHAVTLGGFNYHGLGLRFLADLDPMAVHSVAGLRPSLDGGRQDVSVAPWAAVSFEIPGRPVTLLLTGHPANPGGDPAFFSMRTPFAYLSATQGLDRRPRTYRSGERFALDYLILVAAAPEVTKSMHVRAEAWRR